MSARTYSHSSMTTLLELPHEVLHHIFTEADPQDLAALACCCRVLNDYVNNNHLLFKELFLKNYDLPPREVGDSEISWSVELPKRVRLEKLLLSSNVDLKISELSTIAAGVTQLLDTASPNYKTSLNVKFLSDMFLRQENIESLLCGSSIWDSVAPARQTHQSAEGRRAQQQLSAKLHSLYGVPIELPAESEESDDAAACKPFDPDNEATPPPSKPPIHAYARSLVYDLRKYTDASLWGPFMDDGTERVDWEKVEAIIIVLHHSLGLYSQNTRGAFQPPWETPWAGASPKSFRSMKVPCVRMEPAPPLAAMDPYNVTGIWMRVVCFLDYHDLYAFNFSEDNTPSDRPRGPIETEEAIRIITMKIRVTKIEPPGEDDGQALPVVHFNGTSQSMHMSWDRDANSRVRGSVRLTREGEVRWTTFSIFHGEERWRSEGVQVGGVQSARGVIGNWFDKDFDVHGPAGPTAFWKMSDDIPEKQERSVKFNE